jgi:tetrahydromethanopterin S-methyltransferase subunit G
MSVLFKVEGKAVIPHTETLLIEPFKTIWERDTTSDKVIAMDEFKFIEFSKSMLKTNPYGGYNEDKKEQVIIEQCIHMENWQPDELVIQGQHWMVEFQTNASPTYSYYMAAKIGAEEMKTFFLNFSMNEVNLKTGNPIYKPRDITSALKDTNDIIQRLDSMKSKVEQEIFEVTKKRGEKTISPFAKTSM